MSERDVKRLLALVEKHLGREWREVSDWLRDQNSIDAIESRLLAGDYAGVVREIESAARRFATETHSQYLRSGHAGTKWLDDKIPDRLIRFDVTNERAVYAARRNELQLVSGLTTEARETTMRVMVDGQRAGLNPRSVAREIRDSITLTPNQAQHVSNYRRALTEGRFGDATRRELRDARSDRTLARLSRDGGQLTEKQIDTMVERYRKNYVAYRAEVIARTESARNVHAGLAESFTQAIERGDIEAEAIVREWIAGPRTQHARDQHQAMNGQQRKWNEAFEAPDGTRLMHPGDGPPEHAAQCRCTVATTLAG